MDHHTTSHVGIPARGQGGFTGPVGLVLQFKYLREITISDHLCPPSDHYWVKVYKTNNLFFFLSSSEFSQTPADRAVAPCHAPAPVSFILPPSPASLLILLQASVVGAILTIGASMAKFIF